MLVAPGLVPRVVHTLGEMIQIALAAVFRPRKRFRIPIGRPEMFTRNPQRIEYIQTDLHTLRECSARFFIESVRMDRYLHRHVRRILVPALLLLAKDDPIIDNEKCTWLFTKFGSPLKVIRTFAGVGHTLEFEKDIGFLVKTLAGWIEERSRESLVSA